MARNDNRDWMMRRERFLPLLLLGLALGQAPTVQSAEPASASDGKFHLIYLVSAVDFKPGSKVYVDPIFFADGKEVKNFHDHCKPGKRTLKPEQIVGDLKFIEDYCAKKTFTFDPKGYHTLNNHGERVTLDTVEFRVFDFAPPSQPVMMGHSVMHSFVPGEISPPRWLRGDGGAEFFFLMASDKMVLDRIVPVARIRQPDVEALAKRAEDFAKVAKGKISGTPVRLADIERVRQCHLAHDSELVLFRMENPLIADFDVDGSPDLLVRSYNLMRLRAESDRPLIECFSRYYIYGNGQSVLNGAEEWIRTPWARLNASGGTYERYVRNGYGPQAPLLAVRLDRPYGVDVFRMEYVADSNQQHPYGVLLLGSDPRHGFSLYKLRGEMSH
jgi:hypothetical protein